MNSVVQAFTLAFSTDPDQTGAAPGVGVVGRKYVFSKLVQITPSTAAKGILYSLTNWNGLTTANKTLRWHHASIRAATQEEIARQTVLAPLQAQVQQTADTLTTTSTALATLSNKVLAGNPNIVPNGGFEKGLQGWTQFAGAWNVDSGLGWGPHAFWVGNTTAILGISGSWFLVAPNAQYTIAADMALFASNANAHCYVDIIYIKADGSSTATGSDTGQNAQFANFDFSTNNSRRGATAFTSTAPADAVYAFARFVVNPNGATVTYASVRQIKVERGNQWTPYTNEASAALVAGALSTAEGKLAAYLELTAAAGSSAAAVRLNANGQNSSVELQADAIRLGSSTAAAMDVVGGQVYFYGKVTAQSIDTNELKIGGVTTDRIFANAITNQLFVFNGSNSGFSQNVWTTTETLTFTNKQGQPNKIEYSCDMDNGNINNIIRILRDGSVIYQPEVLPFYMTGGSVSVNPSTGTGAVTNPFIAQVGIPFQIITIDNPGIGTYTYEVQCYRAGDHLDVQNRLFSITEFMR